MNLKMILQYNFERTGNAARSLLSEQPFPFFQNCTAKSARAAARAAALAGGALPPQTPPRRGGRRDAGRGDGVAQGDNISTGALPRGWEEQ